MTAWVAITGTSGFVGGALATEMRRCGWRVLGLSRRPARVAVDRDVRHDLSLPVPADVPPVDVVVHAAALAAPWAAPDTFRRHIVETTRNALAYARRAGAGHFVLISSTAVLYREGDQFDLAETSPWPKRPINGYAAAKREAEALVAVEWPGATILRPRAVYGPGDTVLFPRILAAARKGLLPRIRRADGASPVADLVFVGNLVHAIRVAAETRLAGVLHATDGAPVETAALLADVLARLGIPAPRLTLSATTAMRIAGAAEWLSRTALNWREPPITRFGVSAMVHSKTFDPARMRAAIGPLPFTTREGVAAFVVHERARAGR